MLSPREPGWIYKPSWDLPLLIFSAILVPLPFLAAWGAQVSGWLKPQQAIDAINIAVAALVGAAPIAQGSGRSKKLAEQDAARRALETLSPPGEAPSTVAE